MSVLKGDFIVKTRTTILHTAVTAALLATATASFGGTLTGTSITFATQNFGATAPTTTAVDLGTVTYTFSTPGGIVINDGGVINIYFRLDNAKFVTGQVVTGDFSGTAVTGLLLTKTSVTLSTDKKTAVLTLTNGTGGNVTIGVGSTITFNPQNDGIDNVNTTLNSASGTVGFTASASVLAANADATSLPADVDGGVASSLTMATAASGITGTAVASSDSGFATVETKRIDLTATTPSTVFTPASGSATNTSVNTKVNLGSVTYTNGTAKQVDGSTAYSIAANASGMTVTATPGSGAWPIGATLRLYDTADCSTTAASAASAAVTSGTATSSITLTKTSGGGLPTTATPVYVCLTVDGTNTISQFTPSITAALTKTVATESTDSVAATNLYALRYNGSQVDVATYIPAAENSAGYSSFIRIINDGSVAAAPTVSVINPSTGAVTTLGTLPSLAAGAAITYTNTELEAAVGAVTGTAPYRPRLRITAPASSMKVQSFIMDPARTFNEVSSQASSTAN